MAVSLHEKAHWDIGVCHKGLEEMALQLEKACDVY